MLGQKLPGQRSNIALLITGAWAILGVFILIIGHLTLIYFAYGQFKGESMMEDLATSIPMLTTTHLYITAALAIALDIWIFISQKKQRAHKIKR